MSDPLYLAAKMALYQFRVSELFENKQRSAAFNETLQTLQYAIEAYEAVNGPMSPRATERFNRDAGSWATEAEEASQ